MDWPPTSLTGHHNSPYVQHFHRIWNNPGEKDPPIFAYKFKRPYPLLTDASITTPMQRRVSKQVENSCVACAVAERRRIRRMISLTHIHFAFHEEVQTDFCVSLIDGGNVVFFNNADCKTKFGYRAIVPGQSTKIMQIALGKQWICIYGAPKSMSADLEVTTTTTKKYLSLFLTTVNKRPA